MHQLGNGRGGPRDAPQDTANGRIKKFQRLKIDQTDPLCGAVFECEDKSSKRTYSIVGKIDEGGMGAVFLARDNQTGEDVAVKTILEKHLRSDDGHRDRFFREASLAVLIDHKNVVRMLDVGTYKGHVFLVMEFLEGPDLGDIVRAEKKISWDRLAPLIIQVSDGVGAAHALNVMHRDLKPDNIKLIEGSDGKYAVKIVDFGLAKSTTGEGTEVTKSTSVLGTPPYIAPEQLLKAYLGRGEYDIRIDVYAMGVIMYRILTGVFPYPSGDDLETRMLRTHTPPRPPRQIDSSIPEDVERVILKAMAIDVQDRYGNASELAAALRACKRDKTLVKKSVDQFIDAGIDAPEKKISAAEIIASIEATPDSRETSSVRMTEEERKAYGRSHLTKALKGFFIAGMAAGLVYAAYHYREHISHFIKGVRERIENSEPAPAPSGSTPVRNEFQASITSTPPGAAVFELGVARRPVRIGTTPLSHPFPNGEHRLRIILGNGSREVTVSETSPDASVTFRSPAKAPGRREREEEQAPEPVRIDEIQVQADGNAPEEENQGSEEGRGDQK
jgi:serine/threonine-protein kinase